MVATVDVAPVAIAVRRNPTPLLTHSEYSPSPSVANGVGWKSARDGDELSVHNCVAPNVPDNVDT